MTQLLFNFSPFLKELLQNCIIISFLFFFSFWQPFFFDVAVLYLTIQQRNTIHQDLSNKNKNHFSLNPLKNLDLINSFLFFFFYSASNPFFFLSLDMIMRKPYHVDSITPIIMGNAEQSFNQGSDLLGEKKNLSISNWDFDKLFMGIGISLCQISIGKMSGVS